MADETAAEQPAYRAGSLTKGDEPYRRGQRVTTDPQAPPQASDPAVPVFVDAGRFESWVRDKFLKEDAAPRPMGGDKEEES